MQQIIFNITFLYFFSSYVYAQEVNTSYKTIYLIEDHGLLDNTDADERTMITLSHSSEEWNFFFEKERLIAFECMQKDFPFKELTEVKNKVYKDETGNLKLYTKYKTSNVLSVTIESSHFSTNLYFSQNNNEEATLLFKKLINK